MANIIGIKEKQLAVKEINRKLKTLKPINDFLNADNPSGIYTIAFDNYEANLLCQDSDAIKALVFAFKQKVVAELRKQAEEFSIEFDEEDEKLLK